MIRRLFLKAICAVPFLGIKSTKEVSVEVTGLHIYGGKFDGSRKVWVKYPQKTELTKEEAEEVLLRFEEMNNKVGRNNWIGLAVIKNK